MSDILERFPELNKYKPPTCFQKTGYWFDPSDKKVRDEIIKKVQQELIFTHVSEILDESAFRVPLSEVPKVSSAMNHWLENDLRGGQIEVVLFDLDKTMVFSERYYGAIEISSNEIISSTLKIPTISR